MNPSNDRFLFPVLLLGNASSVKRRCMSLVKSVLRSDEWAGAEAPLERMSVLAMDNEILLYESRLMKGEENCWRLYCLRDAWELATCQDANAERIAELTLSGMDRLWFTISMLQRFQLAVFRRRMDWKSQRESFFVPVLERVVAWLPEIALLHRRFVDHLSRELDEQLRQDGYSTTLWAQSVGELCRSCDYPLTGNEVLEEFSDDPIDAMLDRGIIRRIGDRFELNK